MPVAGHHFRHAAAPHSKNLEPEENCPQTVFFADVIAARAETFFAAEGDTARVQQVTEEFPTRWGFKAGNGQLLGHHVDRRAGGHGAGHAGQPSGVTRRQGGVCRQHGQAVAGIDEASPAQNHIAVPVAIAGGAEVVGLAFEQQVCEFMGVGEIWIGVTATEIL